MHKATIKDVAKRSRVSPKTVSRVINNEPSVRDKTRARVLQVVSELNYHPDLSARNLRSAKSYALALAYDNPNPYYVISVQSGVLAACRETGFALQIYPCNGASPTIADELLELARRSRLAGLILAPPMSERPELIQFLSRNGVHLVRILSAAEDPNDGFACVYVDDRDAAYAITEHLIQLGHVRVGFLWGGKAHLSSFERYKGYLLALERYGIPPDETLVLPGDYSFDDGFRGTRKLLSLPQRPTAIFGSNDEIAAGALVAAKSMGIDVPNQLSIAGFEDSPFSRQSWPALTTARQATEEIARTATLLLISELRPNSVSGHRIVGRSRGFTPELVVRGSTARAPASAG